MDLKGIRKVKTNVNLKMGLQRVPAGEVFDVTDTCPEWIKRELEHNLGTVTVIDRKKPVKDAPKKASLAKTTTAIPATKTKRTIKSPRRKKKTDSV